MSNFGEKVELGEQKTEFTKVRESFNFTKADVAKELGISLPVYSIKERDARKSPESSKEQFYYDLWHACSRLEKKKERDSLDLDLNSYVRKKEFNTIEEEIEDECRLELHYPKITTKLYKKLKEKVQSGKTVIQVAVMEGVDDRELSNLLDKEGITYTMGDFYGGR